MRRWSLANWGDSHSHLCLTSIDTIYKNPDRFETPTKRSILYDKSDIFQEKPSQTDFRYHGNYVIISLIVSPLDLISIISSNCIIKNRLK